ncbi:MAG: hypothetical protein V8T51_00795 [Senegalimassilia faecalis]
MRYEASRGVTAICPTTMTLPEERLAPIVASVAEHATADDEAGIVGINMEGPYIAPDKVGAQNPAYVRSASVEEFARLQAAAHGLIKLVDVAPEQPGNLDFIHSVSHDVRVSVAHTCTDYDTACAAFDAGARHMTHLYNAMPSLHHRDPGPIAAGAERNDVTAEIIADGVHIHPAMVRLAFALFGDDRMVSDQRQPARLRFGRWRIRAGRSAVHRARQPRHHCQRQLGGQRVRRHGVHAHGGAAHEHSAYQRREGRQREPGAGARPGRGARRHCPGVRGRRRGARPRPEHQARGAARPRAEVDVGAGVPGAQRRGDGSQPS